ncbi:hypothetical protein ACEZCY_03425 [Streptacidiphilus sp. N1-12]|uniref:Uncharacterized protein n=2 Tax=Streptacidiphilus alkalitolerans TaxID=3342712 RepID=A0ABV6WVM7_9ACTN
MSKYVLTIPGTFLRPLQPDAKGRLLTALQGVDPDQVGSVPDDLDLLTLDQDGARFVLRLEVQAQDRGAAEGEALAVARRALASAGYDQDTAPTGAPSVTAIDVG